MPNNTDNPGRRDNADDSDHPRGPEPGVPPAPFSPPSTVMLRALRGTPLLDAGTRDIVVATARAIAERNGVELRAVDAAPDRVVMTLALPRLAAIGFAAELRRLTTNWYR